MRLLFSSDLHGNDGQYRRFFSYAKKEKVDAAILGGDLAPKEFAIRDFVVRQRAWYSTLTKHFKKYGGEVFAMLGNDDVADNLDKFQYVLHHAGGCYLHRQSYARDDINITGYCCVDITPFPIKDWELHDLRTLSPNSVKLKRGMVNRTPMLEGLISRAGILVPTTLPPVEYANTTIQEDIRTLSVNERTVLVTHAPPAMTSLDVILNGGHVGSIAIREFIEEKQPLISLHGHIHETVRVSGKYMERIGRTYSYSCGNSNATPTVAAILVDTNEPGKGSRIIL